MGVKRIAIVPATNKTYYSINSIFKSFVEHILQNFPPDFFKTVIIDDKNTVRSMYTITNGRIGPLQGEKQKVGKIMVPSLKIEFNYKGQNQHDTQLGYPNLNYFAKAHEISRSLSPYTPFFKDHFGIGLYTSDIYNKCDFDIEMKVTTKDDQLALENILKTRFLQVYGRYLEGILIPFVLPGSLVDLVRKSIYGKDILNMKKEELSDEGAKQFQIDLNNELLKHMSKYVIRDNQRFNERNNISRIHIHQEPTNMQLKLDRTGNINYTFEGFESNDANKRGDFNESFSVSTSGNIQFYNVINYVVSLPIRVNGNEINDQIIETSSSSLDRRIEALYTINTNDAEIDRTRHPVFKPYNVNKYSKDDCVMTWRDCVLDEGGDEIDILEWLKDDIDKEFMFRTVFDKLKIDEKAENTHITIYEGDRVMDQSEFSINWDNFTISVPASTDKVTYTIYLYAYRVFYFKRFRYYYEPANKPR